MPGSPLFAAGLSYQRAAVRGIDMAQSGRGASAHPRLEAGHRRPKTVNEPGRKPLYNFSTGQNFSTGR